MSERTSSAASRNERDLSLLGRRPLLVSLLAAAALLAACTAALHQTEVSSVAQQGSPGLPQVRQAPEAPEASASEATPLNLSSFRPVLSEPDLQEVARKAEALEWAAAAELMEAHLEGQDEPSTPVEAVRRRYVAGMLQLEAGDLTSARAHFDRALGVLVESSVKWAAHADLALRAAELALDAGDIPRAEALLADTDPDVAPGRWLELMGRTQLAARRPARASSTFSRWVSLTEPVVLSAAEAPEPDAEIRRARLWWARALLELAETSDPSDEETAPAVSTEEARRHAQKALEELERARRGLPSEHPFSIEVGEEVARALVRGAAAGEDVTTEERLAHLRGLIDAREHDEAQAVLASIQLPVTDRYSAAGCQRAYLEGKLRQSERKWGEAADALTAFVEPCTQDPDLHSWLLFNAGKYSAADGRNAAAVRYYGDLERLYPESSLADDARLRAARCYEEMGSIARFVELLSSMPEDYPDGDMTREGVMLLALREMQAHRWSSAAGVLERASGVIRDSDSARGHEYAGTERYFWARCLMELGEEERALREYETLVRDVPLSYYMLHAYSRLLEADRDRARAALDAGLDRAKESPFSFPYRPVFESPAFLRGMELLRVADTDRGRGLLSRHLDQTEDSSLMWGLALLFDRAGDVHHAHGLARGRLTDWLAQYPEGDWEAPWQIGFPRPYLSLVDRESEATGVPPWFIYGVMREESTFRPRVVSHANAYGLMQIIEPTARGIARSSGHPSSPSALKQPAVNIAIGSRVLQQLGRRFRDNPVLAIPGYNAGPGRPVRWLSERPNIDFDLWVELIPYRETRRYTKRVLASRAAYAFLYYRDQSSPALVMPKRLRFP